MSEPINDYGYDAAGNRVSRGHFIVDRAGNLVVLPVNSPIKESQRYATEAEVSGIAAAPSIEVDDEPVIAEVEAIEIDAPSYDPRDRD